MSRHSPFPDAEFVSRAAPSLATVLERVRAKEELSASRARDLRSSVTRVAKIICPDRPLTDIPADPEWCRIRIARLLPASIGLTAKTWANLTSNFASALDVAGITSRRFEVKLVGDWATLWRQVIDTGILRLRTGLSRFPRFCQQADLRPEEVTDETVAAYLAALRSNDLTGRPEQAVYRTVCAWNLAVERVEGWPQRRLAVPNRRRSYALQWADFPATLEADVDAWLAMGSDDDIFSLGGPRRALAPATVKLRKGSIQRFATALVRRGHPIESLTELRVLVQPEMAKSGLQWLYHRSDRKLGGGLGNTAIAVKMAAKHWVQLPPDDLAKIASYAQRLNVAGPGMTPKNRARMEAFKDPAFLQKLLRLPENLALKAESVHHPGRRAAMFETATAVALLINCPIRFGNLCSLEIETHFDVIGRGQRQRLVLRLPKAMVKNLVTVNFEVPTHVASLMAKFNAVHRSELAMVPSRFLFTKRSADAPIDANTLRRRIVDAIRKNVGVEFTPHNFRHLAGFIVLSKSPGAYEVVRRLLGHKNGSTALDHYVGLENDAAHECFTRILSKLTERHHE